MLEAFETHAQRWFSQHPSWLVADERIHEDTELICRRCYNHILYMYMYMHVAMVTVLHTPAENTVTLVPTPY